jgi:threonine/homoserine/homoserine lactone efflux protein
LRYGAAAGLLTVVGVELGELCLLTAALAGVTVSAECFPVLFRWLGLAGVVYLAWSAMSVLWSRTSAGTRNPIASRARMPVVEGLTVALANPATLVFYTAFFQQFLQPDRSVAQQTLALGAVYLLAALACDLALVLTLARIRLPAVSRRFGNVMRLGSAGTYLAVAIIGIAAFVRA